MEPIKIRHPRLDAWYNSSVMNIASIGAALTLLFIKFYGLSVLAGISCAVFFAVLLGYSLWYWIGAKKNIPLSPFLSDISGRYVIYFLIVMAQREPSEWWLYFAFFAAVATLFIYLIRNR